MSTDPHSKIIRQLCKEFLLPLGAFQKGTSRIYIDDNGYFFTVVEFQPSGYAKGTFLNIALHFLWNEREYLSFDYPYGASIRVRDFVEYQNDAQFTKDVTKFVREAASQILFYRQLQDPAAAKNYAKKWAEEYAGNPHIGELEVIHHLDDKDVIDKIKHTRAYWRSKPSMKKMHHHEIFDV